MALVAARRSRRLFASQPFPTAESWSIAPPGPKQLEALNRCVRERLLAHQRQRQINQVYPSGHSNPSSGGTLVGAPRSVAHSLSAM